MQTLQKQVTIFSVLFALLILSPPLRQSVAEASNPATSASPASRYTEWEEWSAPIDKNQFDITKCTPDSMHSSPIQSGDFNGDGLVDLFCQLDTPKGSTPFVQLAGQGTYSEWEAWRRFPIEPGCEFNLVADFNGNGLDDWLCIFLWEGRYESFYVGSHGDRFSGTGVSIGREVATAFNPNRCHSFLVSDVNRDGREDVICHYLNSDKSSVTRVALDDGKFTHLWDVVSPLSTPDEFRLDFCVALKIGDVDGDGQLDQICSYLYPSGQSATWVQLARDGTFSIWILWSEFSPPGEVDLNQCHYLHTVDVDGDGLIDLLCMYQAGTKSGVLVKTDGPDTPLRQYGKWESWFELNTDVLDCRTFAAEVPDVIDVNGDGRSDILCAYRNGADSMTTWIQASSGSEYEPWQAWTANLPFEIDRCHVLIAGHVDDDQHVDLICPYLHADGSTATYVQRVDLYRMGLPVIQNGAE